MKPFSQFSSLEIRNLIDSAVGGAQTRQFVARNGLQQTDLTNLSSQFVKSGKIQNSDLKENLVLTPQKKWEMAETVKDYLFLVNLFIFLLFPENSEISVFGEFVYFWTFPEKFSFQFSVFGGFVYLYFWTFPEKFRLFSFWWICLLLDFSRKN